MPYILIIVLPFLAATIKNNSILIKSSFFIMFIIAGTRYETGGDLIGYQNYLDETLPLSDFFSGSFSNDITTQKYYVEFFYTLINSICTTFNLGITGVYIVTAAIINFVYYKSIKCMGREIDAAIFLLLFSAMLFPLMEMHYIRQGLSSAFLLLMIITWNREKSVFKFFTIYLFAIGTHVMTAVTFGPLLFAHKISKKNMLSILIVASSIYIFQFKLFTALLSLLNLESLTLFMAEYTELEIDKGVGLSLTSYLSIITLVANLLFTYRKYQGYSSYRISLYLIFLHAVFSLVTFEFPIFNRTFFSFLIGYPMLAAFLFKHSLYKPMYLACILLFSMVYFTRIYYIDASNYELFFPYKSVFFEF